MHPFLLTSDTLLFGNNLLKAFDILLMILGYFLSQLTLNRIARPLGFDKLPSPNATPTIYAKFSRFPIPFMPEVGVEPTSLAARDFESRMFTNFITPALDTDFILC